MGLLGSGQKVYVEKMYVLFLSMDERRKFQFFESGDSLNGRNLFTELPFQKNSLPSPSFAECLDPIQLKWRKSKVHSFLGVIAFL